MILRRARQLSDGRISVFSARTDAQEALLGLITPVVGRPLPRRPQHFFGAADREPQVQCNLSDGVAHRAHDQRPLLSRGQFAQPLLRFDPRVVGRIERPLRQLAGQLHPAVLPQVRTAAVMRCRNDVRPWFVDDLPLREVTDECVVSNGLRFFVRNPELLFDGVREQRQQRRIRRFEIHLL
ncbi:MAG: hypothetical protein M3Q69_09250 [Acidobacteriota bacterium]|nr:hypothetical protein [Acidobacteriota bacterium]